MCSFTDNRVMARPKRGAVLVLVLGFVLIMGWLGIEILSTVRKELVVKSSPAGEAQLRRTAYQLLETSIAVIAEIRRFEGGIYSPSQGWGVPLTYAGMKDSEELSTATRSGRAEASDENSENDADRPMARAGETETDGAEEGADELLAGLLEEVDSIKSDGRFARPVNRVEPSGEGGTAGPEMAPLALPEGIETRVRIFDEGGKLPLRTTTEERWNLFFEEMEFEESEGRKLTDSLLDWMDPDDEERENGAETSTYSQEDPPYRAPNRPLRDFRELRLVEGFRDLFFDEMGIPNDRYRIFRSNVSLYNTGEVNLNTASELVLQTLAEEQGFEADNVLDFLAGADLGFGTEDDRVFRPGLSESDLPKDADGNAIAAPSEIQFLTVEIALSAGQAIYRLQAVLDISQPHKGGVYPFRITRILENQPLE